MKHYELVLVMDAMTSMDTIKKVAEDIQEVIPNLLATDDMGMLPLVTKLNGHGKAYFLSYYFQSDSKGLDALKQYVRITRAIAKSHIFAMTADEKFYNYADLKKTYETLAERDQPKKVAKTATKQVEVMEETQQEVLESSEEETEE
jgi:ribosomal protein S6